MGSRATEWPVGRNNYNNRFNVNSYNYNNRASRGIAFLLALFGQKQMKTYRHLYEKLCSFEKLEDAYFKARKRKTLNPKVMEFDKHWRFHLFAIQRELRNFTYSPMPMKKFVLRDPKTRIICVSEFRDRVVHHAIVNILQPIFEPGFIYDSYASRKGKGTFAALERFGSFLRKVTENGKLIGGARNANEVCGYALKADIRHYFDSVSHEILIEIIGRRIKDNGVIWLIKSIIGNYNSGTEGKGMPLGNWTSQFFANIYLNELDQFIKHKLKAKYYLRYVDDFVILHSSKKILLEYERQIKNFLRNLQLELHPDKCRVIPASVGIGLLGFRVFYHYRLVRKRNIRAITSRLNAMACLCLNGHVESWKVIETMRGWNAYAMQGNTYKLRKEIECHAKSSLKPNAKIKYLP